MASRHFKIQGLQLNVHCSRNRLDAVYTKLSRNECGTKELFSDFKKSAKAANCDDAQDACVRDVEFILNFSECRKNKYISAGKGWS